MQRIAAVLICEPGHLRAAHALATGARLEVVGSGREWPPVIREPAILVTDECTPRSSPVPWPQCSTSMVVPCSVLAAVESVLRELTPTSEAQRREAVRRIGALGAPTSEELAWLRAFTEGSKTLDVAEAAGMSGRELYRRLAVLYRKLGCTSRSAAIAAAVRYSADAGTNIGTECRPR